MKYLPLFILIIIAQSLQAQQLKTIVDESFDNNERNWTLYQSKEHVSSIQDGQYRLECKKGSYNLLYNNLYIDYSSDFEIEASFEYQGGAGQYGLIWGRSKDYKSFEIFAIDRSRWSVSTFENSQQNFPKLKHSKAIKKKKNQLKVIAHQGQVTFWINQKEVFKTSIQSMGGVSLGFYLKDEIQIAVDHLIIKQNQEINLVEEDRPSELVKENLKGINSKYIDSGVKPSVDGKTLYFSRTGDPNNTGTTKSDIYIASLDKNNQWGNVRKIERPLNNAGSNYVIAVSPDENMMIVGNTYTEEGSPDGGGLSITYKTKDGDWEIPEQVIITRQYNRTKYAEYALSPDSRVLLSSVQRDDTEGSKDIYVSFLQKDDSWSKPKNIGNVVNTAGNEVGPYIAADGVTLYYSTDGFPGYGGHDVYMTKRLDDTWLHWSKPKNLGPAINSKSFDAYYTVSADGKYAYMVSSTPDNQEDIFRMYVPKALQPEPIILVKGRVLDAQTKKPIQSKIQYGIKDTPNGLAFSNAKDGSYKLALKAGSIYQVAALAQEYLPDSLSIDVQAYQGYQEIQKDIYLNHKPIAPSIPQVTDLNFGFDKSILNASSQDLQVILDFLKQNPVSKLKIEGHTDNTGPSYYNMILSQRRAQRVAQYFIKHGITKERLLIKAFGETQPKQLNNTYKGRAANRRVELIIKVPKQQ